MIPALLKLMRLYYSLPLAGGFVVILYYLTGDNISPVIDKTIPAALSLFFIISGGYVLNDIFDIDIDRINCPGRMLPSGKVTLKTALLFSIILFILGLICAGFGGIPFLTGIIIVTGLLTFYDLYSKRMGIFKDILVAILMTLLYPLAFALAEPVRTPRLNVLFIHPFWLFITCLGYEMLKDIRDVKGDINKYGNSVKNFGRKRWFLVISRILAVTAALVNLLPFFLGYCRLIYLMASVGAIILAIASTFNKPVTAIRYIYAEVFLITAGSMADLMVFGP